MMGPPVTDDVRLYEFLHRNYSIRGFSLSNGFSRLKIGWAPFDTGEVQSAGFSKLSVMEAMVR